MEKQLKRRKGTALVRNEERVLRRVWELKQEGRTTVHGYGLAKKISGPDVNDPPMAVSTLYRCLDRLEERGLVESFLETGPSGHQGPARRVYRTTASGDELAVGL